MAMLPGYLEAVSSKHFGIESLSLDFREARTALTMEGTLSISFGSFFTTSIGLTMSELDIFIFLYVFYVFFKVIAGKVAREGLKNQALLLCIRDKCDLSVRLLLQHIASVSIFQFERIEIEYF